MKKSSKAPPSLARKLLEGFVHYDDEFNILDTLHDLYNNKCETEGKRKANIWYWRQVLLSIPKNYYSRLIWRLVMIISYLIASKIRDLFTFRVYSWPSVFLPTRDFQYQEQTI